MSKSSKVSTASCIRIMTAVNCFSPGCSRSTLTRAIADEMITVIQQFREIVKSIPGRVASDYHCSGKTLRSSFVITVHWIDEYLVLRDCILGCEYILPTHNY